MNEVVLGIEAYAKLVDRLNELERRISELDEMVTDSDPDAPSTPSLRAEIERLAALITK